MALEHAGHAHPLVKAGVVAIAVVLALMFILSAVSLVVGVVWTIIKVALVVLLIAGLLHLGRRMLSRA
jgi:hypothetical protein